MKIHVTIDKDGHNVFHASRKQAIDLINSDHERFPSALGFHYRRLEIGNKIADMVDLLNNVKTFKRPLVKDEGDGWKVDIFAVTFEKGGES